ncbi:hypothetical protein WT25_16280 [Burkholderia territorii]|uniref:thioredoxin family protein n=1 Tax=Burkholderia territorii TaxID=1503055 RepID=UPI00075A74F9|nr:thioredoxin domain-containing protein [Burkholderia territorii]KVT81250.1 hypothetical protein WT25_16280 [Burkholderia territorii]
MTIEETTEATLDADIQGACPVLVEFWDPLAMHAPQLERLAADYAGRLKVLTLNLDEAPGGWQHFGMRFVPTLVLYANGTEYNRVVIPTAMRLRVMIEKWLGELGLDVTVPDRASVDPRIEPAGADASAQPRVWHSFGGDPDLKAQCVARLWDALYEKQFVPSELLAGGKDQFETVVGAPAQLGKLFDAGWRLAFAGDQQETERVRAQAGELAQALPVGADLQTVSTGVLFDLVYCSQWDIIQSLDTGGGLELMTRIRALHVRGISGESIEPADWQALQREAAMLDGHPDCDALSRVLEMLARPLAEWDAAMTVSTVIRRAATDYRRYPDWSRDEAQRVRTMELEIEKRAIKLAKSDVGELPMKPGAERDAWMKVMGKHYRTLDKQCREAQPALWERYDAWCTHEQETRKQILAYLAENLLIRLRACAGQGA